MNRRGTFILLAVVLQLLWSGALFSQSDSVDVVFSVDLQVQILCGGFVEGQDAVDVRGSFNGWSLANVLSQTLIDPNVYQTVVRVDTATHEYKFVIENAAGTQWEGINNRVYHATGFEPDLNNDGIADALLDTVYFNDTGPNDIFTSPSDVVFEVDMRPAHCFLLANDSITFGGGTVTSIDQVHLSGNAGNNTTPELKWVWDLTPGDPSIDSLLMNDDGLNGDLVAGDSIWSITINFGDCSPTVPTWKFGINTFDNEAGFAENHMEDVSSLRVRKQFGEQGTFYAGCLTGIADSRGDNAIPSSHKLLGNYPNPFNPSTTIEFAVAQATNVSIDIFNMLGQKIRTLVNSKMSVGIHSAVWDGKNDSGEIVSSGLYLYRFSAANHFEAKRMLLMK